MTTSIYDLHRKAFPNVSAYVVMDRGGVRRATIAFRYPRDGAGRLWAYVHWCGLEMVRGYASGYGYDKHSAACASAADRLRMVDGAYDDGTPHHTPEEKARFLAFKGALETDSGPRWDDRLRDAGFTVWQAV